MKVNIKMEKNTKIILIKIVLKTLNDNNKDKVNLILINLLMKLIFYF